VERLLAEHVERRRDHSRALWALLALAVWHDEVLASPRPTRAGVTAPSPLPAETTT